MSKYTGTFTVSITPFTPDGRAIEENVLRKYIDWQIEQGIHGLIPLGSTGEFLSLTDKEKEQVIEIYVDQVNKRVPLFIGTAAENTWDAVRYSKQAEDMGADGVMIIPPLLQHPYGRGTLSALQINQ